MKKSSSGADTLTEINLTIFRLNACLLDKGNQLAKPLGITSARWQILGAISNAGKAISCPQIAASMGISRQGAIKQLNLALEDGLVITLPNSKNERSPLYDLTESGIEAFEAIMKLQQKWVTQLAKGVAVKNLKTALSILEGLESRLEEVSI